MPSHGLPHASRVIALAALVAPAGAINRAVAKMSGALSNANVAGAVHFEQAEGAPLGDVTVRVEMSGLTPGQHGFHIHQFGDVRKTANLETMSAHFVPFCIPPELTVDPTTGNLIAPTNGCEDDQKHGLPPNPVRQPGDMGNLLVAADGTASIVLTLGQGKLSLIDPLRSIVGRVVVVHTREDDGTQPYGNAGPPEAYGLIGLTKPPAGVLANGALAPQTPKVTKVICTFIPPAAPLVGVPAVSGQVLLTLLEPQRPGVVQMQAVLQGLSAGSSHSFHFHTWGDMTVDTTAAGALGDIYYANAIAVDSLAVNAQGVGYLDVDFTSPTLLQHVGRSLTIHAGPTTASATIAAATCGLANPHATLSTPPRPAAGASQPISGGSVALIVLSVGVAAVVGATGCLYRLRKPIPLCGKWIYAHEPLDMAPPPPAGAPPPMVELRVTGV